MDPNPIKHPAVLLARVRDSIEPTLLNAGFQFDSRNSPRDPGRTHLWIDYVRGDDFIGLRWDRWQKTLSLELITSSEDFEMIACVSLSGCRSARAWPSHAGVCSSSHLERSIRPGSPSAEVKLRSRRSSRLVPLRSELLKRGDAEANDQHSASPRLSGSNPESSLHAASRVVSGSITIRRFSLILRYRSPRAS